jgi:hypothetical protein
MSESKEPFVPREDRPDVSLNPDTPISELRVRDLTAILHSGLVLKKREFKDFIKDFKIEKFEIKELKFEKYEKFEKFEKNEKIEFEAIPKLTDPGPKGFEPGPEPGPIADPRIDRLIEMVSGLTSKFEDLPKRIESGGGVRGGPPHTRHVHRPNDQPCGQTKRLNFAFS